MPLENAPAGSPGFKRNIEVEVAAGKPRKQAIAIAYSKARGDRIDTISSAFDGLRKRFDALVDDK